MEMEDQKPQAATSLLGWGEGIVEVGTPISFSVARRGPLCCVAVSGPECSLRRSSCCSREAALPLRVTHCLRTLEFRDTVSNGSTRKICEICTRTLAKGRNDKKKVYHKWYCQMNRKRAVASVVNERNGK